MYLVLCHRTFVLPNLMDDKGGSFIPSFTENKCHNRLVYNVYCRFPAVTIGNEKFY